MDPTVQKYHLISVPSPTFRGRKKLPGRLIFDPSTQRIAVFLCYCGNCHSKVLADKATVSYLSNNLHKSKRRIVARVLLRAAKKLEA